MDKFPLLMDGRPAGELTAEREALYTWLTARCPLPDGLWCAWVIGEQGSLRLGVLEPQDARNACGVIRRRVSHHQTAPLGRILRGEVRPNDFQPDPECQTAPDPPADFWTPAPAPERLFRTPWLRQRLQGRQGVLTSAERGDAPSGRTNPPSARPVRQGFRLALPWDPRQPFPLPPLFCFAKLRLIGQTQYLVFSFDGRERPVFEI